MPRDLGSDINGMARYVLGGLCRAECANATIAVPRVPRAGPYEGPLAPPLTRPSRLNQDDVFALHLAT